MSHISVALVAVAKAVNVGAKVFEDGKVDIRDAGVLIGNLGELSALAGINVAGILDEAGKLNASEKALAVVEFKKAFDLANDVVEGAVESLVDACFTVLVAVLQAKAAVSIILPKAA